ncbi:MAG: alpha/beta fold hydrolase [Candidatus Lokiarchaeota archaeon]|nr:alpha/beta fold hydrolase [Candidatus Lokiarchaeota archaeon]
MTEKFTNINGLELCYTEKGVGSPVVLIHGIGGKKETWNSQIEDLSEYFKVIAVDLRGVGKSDRPDMPYTMEMLADDIAGLMDSLEMDSAHIIGRSLGGMIAQYFALKYPNKVNKLVLMTTNPRVPDEQTAELIKKGRLEEIRELKRDPEKSFWKKSRLLFHKDFRKKMKMNPDKKFYGIFSANDLIEETTKNPSTPQDIENLSYTLRSHDILDQIENIKHETLLISGSHDRLTPKSSMLKIQKRIPNSKIEIITNSGHFLHLSHAPEVNKLLIEFLKN